MKTVFEATIAGQYPVKLEQYSDPKRFRVTYGKQVMLDLNSSDAASELGFSIMHAATCAGIVEDDLR